MKFARYVKIYWRSSFTGTDDKFTDNVKELFAALDFSISLSSLLEAINSAMRITHSYQGALKIIVFFMNHEDKFSEADTRKFRVWHANISSLLEDCYLYLTNIDLSDIVARFLR